MSDRPRRLRRWRAAALTFVLAALAALALALSPAWVTRWQEIGFDTLIRLTPAPSRDADPPVIVVDIGATDDKGQNWDRTSSARLAAEIAKAGPAVVAWDIVFAGNCDDSTANLALAVGLSRAPTVLGFLLSGSGPAIQPASTIAVTDSAAPLLWAAPAAETPCPAFAATSRLASLSLPGDAAARVRMVPAAVLAAGIPWPSLPVEAVSLAQSLPTPLVNEDQLLLGTFRLPLAEAAMLRFRPSAAAPRAARTLAASDVLSGTGVERLAGAIVLVGSSLPARGGLRPTAVDPLYPSVQIAADLTEGLLAGRLPHRAKPAALAEALVLFVAATALAAMIAFWPPLRTVTAALCLSLGWCLVAAATHAVTGQLLDPVLPPLALTVATTAGLVLQAATTYRAERVLRGRMGQLLPAAVVSRLIDEPNLLRLKGERREVTALFTDLEGFSAMTNSIEPEALIATLDRYFTVVSAVVLRHGGMIDKIVGDAVHALFNAPLDQPGHVDAALAAAAEIVAETEALRPLLGIGRTRVGVETGPAILGDVGSGARIDYTAHGPAVNLAARLQEAGKTLGPAVTVGPMAASLASRPLRKIGQAEVRSFGLLDLFTLEDTE